jgi:predicted nucleic acid-binding protein
VYLVDTNVISEARKGAKANPGVIEFWRAADGTEVYLSAQTVGELRRGLENIRLRGDHAQAKRLAAWLESVTTDYADRILAFDADCAQVWGKLMSPHPQHSIDKQIAAIALIHDLTVVTRNTEDFRGTGVRLHNPFR